MSFWKWMKETYLSWIMGLKNSRLVALNFWMYFLGVIGCMAAFITGLFHTLMNNTQLGLVFFCISFGSFILGNYGWYREYE